MAATLSTRVSLAPAARRAPATAVPCGALLEENGARVILGATSDSLGLAAPVVPSAASMFGPRGACAAPDGSLWVSDTGHHRVLGWRRMPSADNTPADILLGQPAFDREGRNAHESVSAFTLNVPTGITACGDGLAVADAWNHRVLLWHTRPTRSHQPPDVVLGQADATGGESNRGRDLPSASTLFWPYCVAWDGARLWVADTGNRRVLMWNGLPRSHGAAASLVLGQPGFEHRDENGGAAPGASSMRWPHAISFPRGGLCVADAGNNRLMLWQRPPQHHNAPCDIVIGQAGMHAAEHNQGSYHPDAACLNMPYGAAVAGDLLVVADTANSRLLAWRIDELTHSGLNACALAAQPDWNSKGDNRWHSAARDSVCWPYSVAVHEPAPPPERRIPECEAGRYSSEPRALLVADSGNNRVLLWRLAGAAA